ncbi:MAG: cysteine--tRNA ligase [Moraxellaceae bacterium]|nr:cysteine--tRNA ligase [Pseudobdellovibrionaceae bacterium]
MLKVYNSMGHKLEEFKPLNPGQVKIYVCGPTVYSYLHVGNFRGPVFFNFVRNWLEHIGYKVEFAVNFTDVDDKIIKRAQDENVSAAEISEKYITEYKKEFESLGLRPHDHNPKVTTYMPEIIEFVKTLIEKDHAYVSGGDVNFSISKFTEYGKLSGRKVDDLLEGVRIDVNEKKQSPLDFVLWKTAKTGENLRGSAWESPWGAGRPGWHVECSAIVKAIFGNQIDIHGGGLDLLFPHHENEVAQSQSCNGEHYAKYWMHWNLLNFGGSKMSKSLGNIVNMHEFLGFNHPEIYKWMMLSVHYRSVADFSDATVDFAVAGLARVYSALSLATSLCNEQTPFDRIFEAECKTTWDKMTEALNHDFGTPAAFAEMFELVRKYNAQVKRGAKVNVPSASISKSFLSLMNKFGSLLSLFQESPSEFLIKLDDKLLEKKNLSRATVNQLVEERARARSEKDFKKSDELRKKLTEMGISISDLTDGSFWEVTK